MKTRTSTPKATADTIDRLVTQVSVATTLAGSVNNPSARRQIYVDNIAALKAVSVAGLPEGAIFTTKGYYTNNDEGGADYYYTSASSSADDGGSVIAPTVGSGRFILIGQDSVNVRQFGAVGSFDSSAFSGANDSSAFSAAATYAAASGKPVFIPPGVYGVSSIDPKSGVIWKGAGIGETIICPWNGTTADNLTCFLTPTTGYTRNEFSGMTFKGNNVLSPGLNSGGRALFLRGDEITLDQVEILDWKYMGVGVIANRVSVTRCRVYQCSRDAFNLTGSHKAIFSENRIEACSDDGVAIHNTTSVAGASPAPPQPFCDVIVANNIFTDCFGIKILGATRCVVSGNVLHRPKSYGIYVSGIDGVEGVNDAHSVIVIGNVIEDVIASQQIPGFGDSQTGIYVRARTKSVGSLLSAPGDNYFQTPSSITNDGSAVATVTTSGSHGLARGSSVVVSGCTETAYNGRFTVLDTPSATTFRYVMASTIAAGSATGSPRVFFVVPYENYWYRSNTSSTWPRGGARGFVVQGNVIAQTLPQDIHTAAISSLVRTGTTVDVTTSVPHGLSTGEVVTIRGVTGDTAYNNQTGGWTVTVGSPTTFSFQITGSPGAATVTNAVAIKATLYQDWGYGGLYNKGSRLNLPVWRHKLAVTGIRVEGGVRDVLIQGNVIQSTIYGIQFASAAGTLRRATIADNQFWRCSQFGVLGDGSSADMQMTITGNQFDGDPFMESPQRAIDGAGGWQTTQAYPAALSLVNWRGIYVADNTFRNLYQVLHGSSTLINWGQNNAVGSFTDATNGSGNRGVRNLNSLASNFRLVWEDANPTSATFGTISFTQGDLTATAIPSTGSYLTGQIVWNRSATISSGNIVVAWYRLTNGSNHVAGTDWAEVRAGTSAFNVP